MKTEVVLLGMHINIASQARRRRLVVLIYAGFAALGTAWFFVSGHFGGMFLGWLILFGFMFLGRFLGGRSSSGGLLPPLERDDGDERELHRRDHAYFMAYKWWDLTLVPALVAVGFKNNSFYPTWDPVVRGLIDRLPVGLLAGAVVLYYTLPQVILLWTEPDMEPQG